MLKKLLIAAVILTSSFGFSVTEAAQSDYENCCGKDSYCYENYNDRNCYDDDYCGGGYCGYGRGCR